MTDPLDDFVRSPAGWLAACISEPTSARRAEVALEAALRGMSPGAIEGAARALPLRPDQRSTRADPLLRRLLRTWMACIADVRCEGLEHLEGDGPTVLLCNHLSFADTTVTDLALVHGGAATFADRLVTLAGPKVWEAPLHALATGALNTVATVQSPKVASVPLPPREAARQLRISIDTARALLVSGAPILVYPEGTRSRTGRMQPFLRGVRRYLEEPGTQVVPVALSGTGTVYPVGATRLRPGPVRLVLGPRLTARSGEEALEAAYHQIAAMVPASHKPPRQQPAVV